MVSRLFRKGVQLFVRLKGQGSLGTAIRNEPCYAAAVGKFDGAKGHCHQRALFGGFFGKFFGVAAGLSKMRPFDCLRGHRSGRGCWLVAGQNRRRGRSRLLDFLPGIWQRGLGIGGPALLIPCRLRDFRLHRRHARPGLTRRRLAVWISGGLIGKASGCALIAVARR